MENIKNQQRYVKSYTHAEAWLTKAAQQRHPDAQLMLAFIAYNKNEIEKATKWYLRAAENGSNLAKLHLAALYYNEEIQIEDPIIILNYLFDITNSNLINAKKLMGHYYERGLLVGKDKNKALEWYLKAYSALPYSSVSNKLDKNELSELNFHIGNLYYDDEISLKNYSIASFHLKLALEHKESKYYLDASFLIGEIHFLGKISGVPDYKEAYLNYQNVVDFKVNSINSNFKKTIARAQSRLSEMYKKGLYVYLDEKEALRWYELSLETQKKY